MGRTEYLDDHDSHRVVTVLLLYCNKRLDDLTSRNGRRYVTLDRKLRRVFKRAVSDMRKNYRSRRSGSLEILQRDIPRFSKLAINKGVSRLCLGEYYREDNVYKRLMSLESRDPVAQSG